jgi:hypothetical protein
MAATFEGIESVGIELEADSAAKAEARTAAAYAAYTEQLAA